MQESMPYRILVADDDPSVRSIYVRVLNQATRGQFDAQVDVTGSAEQALDWVQAGIDDRHPYSVAFFDQQFGGPLTGIEAIVQAAGVDPHLEFVLVTGYAEQLDDLATHQGLPPDRFLILKKPFAPIEILHLARGLAHKWSLARRLNQRIGRLEANEARRLMELEQTHDRLQSEMRSRQAVETRLMLSQNLEAVGLLSSSLAHEINSPLQYLSDNASFLKSSLQALHQIAEALTQENEGASAAERLQQIQRIAEEADLAFFDEEGESVIASTMEGIDAITRLVQTIGIFGNGDAASMKPSPLNELLETALLLTRQRWTSVAEIQRQFDPSVGSVEATSSELTHAFMALISNAIHAIEDRQQETPDHSGLISVRSRRDGDCYEVDIIDNGCGISPSTLGRIFEPHFTTKLPGRGSGQGLSIAREIIEQRHRGQILVRSELGQGSQISVRLPILPH